MLEKLTDGKKSIPTAKGMLDLIDMSKWVLISCHQVIFPAFHKQILNREQKKIQNVNQIKN